MLVSFNIKNTGCGYWRVVRVLKYEHTITETNELYLGGVGRVRACLALFFAVCGKFGVVEKIVK